MSNTSTSLSKRPSIMDPRPPQPVPPMAPVPTLPTFVVEEINRLLKEYTTRSPTVKNDPLPGILFHVVDRRGNSLVCAGAGPRDITIPDESVDSNTVLFMGSLTKLVTVIAILILVDRGLIGLDDWETLYELVPELAEKKVLKGFDANEDPILEEVPASAPKITLRMLLANISGFGTTYFSDDLWEYFEKDIWHDDSFGGWEAMIKMPLINVPGERWNYGCGIDFAGKAIERLTGKKLGEWFQENIFEPLNIKNTSFEPNANMCERVIAVHHRLDDGSIIRSPAINFARVSPAKCSRGHHSGGTGLFSTVSDWGVIMSTVMNGGLCEATGKRIISAETLENMFTPQLSPQHLPLPHLKGSRPEFTKDVKDIDSRDPNKTFGLGMVLVGEKPDIMNYSLLPRWAATGTGWWIGATGVLYWIDRATGISFILASTVMPFVDPKLQELIPQLDEMVYKNLQKGE